MMRQISEAIPPSTESACSAAQHRLALAEENILAQLDGACSRTVLKRDSDSATVRKAFKALRSNPGDVGPSTLSHSFCAKSLFACFSIASLPKYACFDMSAE